MSLEMWMGAEQEFAAGGQPVHLFEALGRRGVFVFRPADNIPRAHLRNGGVCYVHSNLFEVCTPECRNPLQLVAYEKACEAYARLASWAHEEQTGERVHLYKTNIASDPRGELEYTTVGAHENYLVERRGWEGKERLLVPYLVLRQVLFGAGGYVRGGYWISPRAIFPKTVYSETSTDYPIMSVRDEPHAGEGLFRVHVVNGEGARSEYTTFLKFSTTSYILQAIQGGHIGDVPDLADPISAGIEIARDLGGDWSVQLSDGGRIKVTDYLNTYYLEGVEKLFSEREAGEHDRMALRELKWALGKLDQGLFEDLETSLEWAIKLSLIERGLQENFSSEEGLDEQSLKEAAAYQYTAVTDPLFDELVESHSIRTVASEGEVEGAFMEPPGGSRGELRVSVAKNFREAMHSLSWSYVKLKRGRGHVQYDFPELEGWTQERVLWTLSDISSMIELMRARETAK